MTQKEVVLETIRCVNCDRKLAEIKGIAEVKCHRCGSLNYFHIK